MSSSFIWQIFIVFLPCSHWHTVDTRKYLGSVFLKFRDCIMERNNIWKAPFIHLECKGNIHYKAAWKDQEMPRDSWGSVFTSFKVLGIWLGEGLKWNKGLWRSRDFPSRTRLLWRWRKGCEVKELKETIPSQMPNYIHPWRRDDSGAELQASLRMRQNSCLEHVDSYPTTAKMGNS